MERPKARSAGKGGTTLRQVGVLVRERPVGRATAVSLALVLGLASGCSGRPAEREAGCVRSTAPAAGAAIGLTASEDFTSTLALIPAADRPGGAAVEWMPVYSVTNLTGAPICVYDIALTFPQREVAGARARLESLGASRQVALYHDLATLREDAGEWTAPTQPPPFTVAAHATVMVRLIQTYRFMVDGEELPMTVQDTLADYLAPYLGLKTLGKGGPFHCGTVFTGLTATVESSLGRSTHDVSHLLMPAGCVRVFPSR